MIADTLCLVSRPNRFDDCRYAALSGSDRYHAAVRSSPSSRPTLGSHPNRSRTLLMSANQSVRSHSRLGMVNNGSWRMSKRRLRGSDDVANRRLASGADVERFAVVGLAQLEAHVDERSRDIVDVDKVARDRWVDQLRVSAGRSKVDDIGDQPGRVLQRSVDRIQAEVRAGQALSSCRSNWIRLAAATLETE